MTVFFVSVLCWKYPFWASLVQKMKIVSFKYEELNGDLYLNGWVFVYELSGCGFESRCCHLNFRYHACFEQGVP